MPIVDASEINVKTPRRSTDIVLSIFLNAIFRHVFLCLDEHDIVQIHSAQAPIGGSYY